MSQLAIDANHNVATVLEGPPVGGVITIASTLAGSWSRIMPSGNTGELVAASADDRYKRMLKIGRADGNSGGSLRGIQSGMASSSTTRYSLDLRGWRLRILNTGYEQIFGVVGFENSTGRVILDKEIRFRDALPATGIEWVLFANNILPIVVHCIGSPTIDIGVVTDPENYTTNNNTVLKIAQLRQHASVSVPANGCDQICVKRNSSGGAIEFSWLEGGVGDYR